MTSSRNGVGIGARGQRSTKYNGGFSAGNLNVDGSFKQTQSVGGSAHINRNGLEVRGNYGQRYGVGGTGRFGNNRIGMKGHFSENTYGGIGGRFNRQGGSIHGNIGRQYTAGGQVDVNGRKVGVNGAVNGQLNGNIGYNKRTGLNGQIGGRGQAHLGTQVGRYGAQANLNVDVGFGRKNGHFDFHGGIHGGLDIKTGNGRNIHIGKQTIKNGVNNGARFIGRQVNKLGNKVIRNVGPRTFGRIVRPSRKR